ncbi:hypothetical protein IscW_ISCW019455 [Ixodes scapularis]|uniref:Uncharacterized protein n=1 Tax=Ixodes scapularis TaxID=6945 RepID=B7PRU1_IXOSC|nr:hypothetical protein IscW_ISCW019455 [Ixodes scapularis]|eukprot:XP_002401209.1 hypothetical protein IscW_ISCW019455 [Ixodes scapularis]
MLQCTTSQQLPRKGTLSNSKELSIVGSTSFYNQPVIQVLVINRQNSPPYNYAITVGGTVGCAQTAGTLSMCWKHNNHYLRGEVNKSTSPNILLFFLRPYTRLEVKRSIRFN